MRQWILLFTCLSIFFGASSALGAHFENMVELTIKIEDASFNHKVRSFKFNDEEIKLDDPEMFKPRKIFTSRLRPGRYMLSWSTVKGGAVWNNNSPVTEHERILVLEGEDIAIKINIKGDSITLY
jgi:hypothetical protein